MSDDDAGDAKQAGLLERSADLYMRRDMKKRLKEGTHLFRENVVGAIVDLEGLCVSIEREGISRINGSDIGYVGLSGLAAKHQRSWSKLCHVSALIRDNHPYAVVVRRILAKILNGYLLNTAYERLKKANQLSSPYVVLTEEGAVSWVRLFGRRARFCGGGYIWLRLNDIHFAPWPIKEDCESAEVVIKKLVPSINSALKYVGYPSVGLILDCGAIEHGDDDISIASIRIVVSAFGKYLHEKLIERGIEEYLESGDHFYRHLADNQLSGKSISQIIEDKLGLTILPHTINVGISDYRRRQRQHQESLVRMSESLSPADGKSRPARRQKRL